MSVTYRLPQIHSRMDLHNQSRVSKKILKMRMEKSMATKTKYELTKKDFRQMNRRNIFLNQLGWNYEKMQGSGYLFIVLPQL
ncbi:PTS system mannose/fructose/sorbose family transporter subunit IID, partial [Oenococcus oeni]|uniref:PTS system mannose/fructose/sorbose family transporter subunit IID n=1 Tax=Oenococcus oeni TaxID=1247 RepID=UPI00214C3336